MTDRDREMLDWLEQVPTNVIERGAAATVRSLLERLEAAEQNYATVYESAERAEQLWMEAQLERDEAREDNERLEREKRDVAEDVWELNAECNLRQKRIEELRAALEKIARGGYSGASWVAHEALKREVRVERKPTIEEMEAILNSGHQPKIEILPNGQITTKTSPDLREGEGE